MVILKWNYYYYLFRQLCSKKKKMLAHSWVLQSFILIYISYFVSEMRTFLRKKVDSTILARKWIHVGPPFWLSLSLSPLWTTLMTRQQCHFKERSRSEGGGKWPRVEGIHQIERHHRHLWKQDKEDIDICESQINKTETSLCGVKKALI